MLKLLLYYLFVGSYWLAWGVLVLGMFTAVVSAESLISDALWWLCLAWIMLFYIGLWVAEKFFPNK